MTNLLHIGWQKCASTLLQQGISQRYPASQTLNAAIFGLHNRVLAAAEAGETLEQLAREVGPVLDGALATVEPGAAVALSDERLSAWRGTHAAKVVSGPATTRYQWLWAQLLHSRFPDRRVLVVCREPLGWLKSLYAQDIKCGAAYCHASFGDWCEGHAEHLVAASHVDALANIYRTVFGSDRVDVVPFELFGTEPALVRQLLAQNFGLDLDPEVFSAATNTSLPPFATEMLRRLHGVIEDLTLDLAIPHEHQRNLRDHLFWFVNHGAITHPNMADYMREVFPSVLQDRLGIPVEAATQLSPVYEPPPGLIEQMSLGYQQIVGRPEFTGIDAYESLMRAASPAD